MHSFTFNCGDSLVANERERGSREGFLKRLILELSFWKWMVGDAGEGNLEDSMVGKGGESTCH
jgi:hypothetical protein